MSILNELYSAFGQKPPEESMPNVGGDYVLKDAERAVSMAPHRGATEPPLRGAAYSIDDLALSDQENYLWQHHLKEQRAGGVRNPDGSISTVRQTTIEVDGRTYNIPTVWDGKILPFDEAIKRVEKVGIGKFPSYRTRDEAERRYEDMHRFMENDMTEKTINATLEKVGILEGGYVNDPKDPGGETNHGVTLKFLRTIKPGSSSEDLKKLTKDDARKLFDEYFVRRPGLDQLPDTVQAEAVALAINAGVPKAIRVLQKAAGVEQDGHLGPETLSALRRVSNEGIKQAVDDYYRGIVKHNPSLERFLKGWLKRSAHINAIPPDASDEESTVEVLKGDDGKLYTQGEDGALVEYNGR